jgi:DNA polymerase-3 subunit delta'
MNSVEKLLQDNIHWQELIHFIEKGTVPGSIGIEIHLPWQQETARCLAHYILCEYGTSCGHCKSCRAWVDDEHPDLLVAGEPDVPASVEECRAEASDLSLSPVIAPVRLLVFYGPEKMSPGAVNSLLKITEEPPTHGHILYMMDKADILPTLRSRLWMLSLNAAENIEPRCPPESASEWLRWLQDNDKNEARTWYTMALGYSAWLYASGKLEQAGMLRQLAETALATHLSSTMWSDLLFLFLREEYSFENVFDDFRQTPLPGVARSGR